MPLDPLQALPPALLECTPLLLLNGHLAVDGALNPQVPSSPSFPSAQSTVPLLPVLSTIPKKVVSGSYVIYFKSTCAFSLFINQANRRVSPPTHEPVAAEPECVLGFRTAGGGFSGKGRRGGSRRVCGAGGPCSGPGHTGRSCFCSSQCAGSHPGHCSGAACPSHCRLHFVRGLTIERRPRCRYNHSVMCVLVSLSEEEGPTFRYGTPPWNPLQPNGCNLLFLQHTSNSDEA